MVAVMSTCSPACAQIWQFKQASESEGITACTIVITEFGNQKSLAEKLDKDVFCDPEKTCTNSQCSQEQWQTPLMLALERQMDLCVFKAFPSLHGKFQDS